MGVVRSCSHAVVQPCISPASQHGLVYASQEFSSTWQQQIVSSLKLNSEHVMLCQLSVHAVCDVCMQYTVVHVMNQLHSVSVDATSETVS